MEQMAQNDRNTENETEYLTAAHKLIFLRFIRAERNFLSNAESYPEYNTILSNDLNEVSFKRNKVEWIEIMNAWLKFVKEEYHSFIKSNNADSALTAEDEELFQLLHESKLWSDPTVEQMNCVLEHFETESHAPNLWATIALELENFGGPKRTDIFWKRAFHRIEKRLMAKQELIDHIKQKYSRGKLDNLKFMALSNHEKRLLNALISERSWRKSYENEKTESKPSIEQLSKHCRICLASTSSQMTYLFSERLLNESLSAAKATLLDKLNYCSCFSQKATIDDGFPQYICMSCSVLLESAYQLKCLCLKSEQKLLEVLNDYVAASNMTSDSELLVDETIKTDNENCEVGICDENADSNVNFLLDIDEHNQDEREFTNKQDSPSDQNGDLDELLNTTEEVFEIFEVELKKKMCERNTRRRSNVRFKKKSSSVSPRMSSRSSVHQMQEKCGQNQCKTCGIVFSNVAALNTHMKCHDENSPVQKKMHQCAHCNKCFKAKNSLTIHMRSHTGERPYVCEACGKAFKTVSAVNNHRAIHAETKDFKCPHCLYSTNTKANLKIHDRTHSRIQPYQCQFCKLKFSTASNMLKHMRNIHEKLKTNKCDECDRSFFSRESLRKHMVTHTGLKPYTCTKCPMSYSWYNGLKKHIKLQHANIKIPTEKSFFDRLQKSLDAKSQA